MGCDAPLQHRGTSQPAEQHRQEPEAIRGGQCRLAPGPLGDRLDDAGGTHADRLAGRPASQVIRQHGGRGVAIGRVLLQAFQADQFEVARNLGIPLRWRFRRPGPHGVERIDHALAAKRGLAGHQRVEDRAQAINVRRQGDRPTATRRLLGAHVGRRAQDRAAGRQLVVGLDQLGQAEVGDVGVPVSVDQDIGRLQVAVEDSAHVSVLNGVGRLDHQGRDGAMVVAVRGELLREVAPDDQLHAEVALTFVLADFIHGDDAGVVEKRDGLGLVLKPTQLGVVGQEPGLHHLEGDRPVEADLPGPVDHAHAAPPQLFLQQVVAEITNIRARRQCLLPARGIARRGALAGVADAPGRFACAGRCTGRLRRNDRARGWPSYWGSCDRPRLAGSPCIAGKGLPRSPRLVRRRNSGIDSQGRAWGRLGRARHLPGSTGQCAEARARRHLMDCPRNLRAWTPAGFSTIPDRVRRRVDGLESQPVTMTLRETDCGGRVRRGARLGDTRPGRTHPRRGQAA